MICVMSETPKLTTKNTRNKYVFKVARLEAPQLVQYKLIITNDTPSVMTLVIQCANYNE